MSKVKNQRVIRKIADRTRQAAKGRNLIAIIAIAMTALMFTAVFTVGGSMAAKQQEATMRQVGGSAHAGYKYLTQAEYDIVKQDKELKEISYRITVGDAVNHELNKLHTEVSWYEDLDAKFSFCYPQEGHMPEQENEIVTSDLVLKALGIPCELGAAVPLEIDIGGTVQKKDFVLSGYFQGDMVSSAQIVAVSRAYQKEVAPVATKSLMNEMMWSESDYVGRIMADFNFDNSFGLEKKVERLTQRCGFPEDMGTGINWAYLGGDLDAGTIALFGVLMAVILISGYLIIYNIFYINVFADIRHYGLLKTIGTTGRQLRRIVRRQAYMLSLFGIPIGLVLGALAGKLLLPLIAEQYTLSSTSDTKVVLNVWVFLGAALFSFATVYISCIKPCRMASGVTPIEALRFTEGAEPEEKKKFRKHIRARHASEHKNRRVTPGYMAFRSILRNKKKVLVVVASLSLALVLLNCIYSLVRGFDVKKFVSLTTVSDFSVADATLDNLSVSVTNRVTDGVTAEFREELSALKGIREAGDIYFSGLDTWIQFTEADWAKVRERVLDNPDVRAWIEQMYEGNPDMSADGYYSYLEEERNVDGKIYGLSHLAFEKLENVKGDLDWEKFRTGNYIITSRYGFGDGEDQIDYFHPGEMVTVFNSAGESREYEVMAVADMPYAAGCQVYGEFNCDYLLPEQEFLDFIGERQPMRTLINVEEDQETAIESWLANYCSNVNPDLTYTSRAKLIAEFDSVKNMYTFVGGMLALVLALIGILNFINTMITSILSRKQELAMLEAAGMSGTQQKQMLKTEGLCYALLAAIAALALAAALNLTVVRSVGDSFFFFTWHFTLLPVILCLPVMAVVVLCVPVIGYNRLCRISVVERMRQAE